MSNDEPSNTSEWHRIADASEVVEGRALALDVGSVAIALYRLGEECFAIGDICPHLEYVALSDGYLEGTTIECPMHQSCFDIRTGAVLSPPAEDNVASYPVRVRDGAVFVQI